MRKLQFVTRIGVPVLGCFVAMSLGVAQAQTRGPQVNPGGTVVLEPGQPPVTIHPTVNAMNSFRKANPRGESCHHNCGTSGNNLYYHGGVSGVGVETAPKVYLVLWGSQWNNNDPSGEAATLESFYQHVGGSGWLNTQTQYCQGVASGTVFCGSSGTHAGNQSGMYAGVWLDNTAAAPNSPTQSQMAQEAINAAAHFGNTASGSNNTTQYVIATAHGYNMNGFAVQWCAWHSSTSSSYGYIAYTNMPYMTDGGASCGANYNGLGPNAGITIVGGHEFAETVTDQFPNGGWLDSAGSETGDKCAWIATGKQGASASVSLNGASFPVQSLWSNTFNSNAGGCVMQ